MDLSLFSHDVRLALLGIAGVAALLAVLLRAFRAPERLVVAAVVVAAAAAVGIGGERVVAWVASSAAGEAGGETTFNDWRWVLLSPWGRVGIGVGVLLALATIALSVRGTLRERSPWRRALLVSLRVGSVSA